MASRRPAWIFTGSAWFGPSHISSVLLKRRPLYKEVPTNSASRCFLHPTLTCEMKCKQSQQRGPAANVIIWAAQLINPGPKNEGDGCFSLPFYSASLAMQVLQTKLQSKHCHASPLHLLPCIDFPEQKLMRKEKKTCRELANLHISESVRLHWWVNSAFTDGTKEKQIWK